MNAASVQESPARRTWLHKPAVSVVIPAYNAAEFLGEALDSVLAQCYQPIEVIVVDDGSEDETPQIVAAYAGRVAYLRQRRGGPASARNAGIRAASGEWIAFLDADDMWMPGLLEKLIGASAETGADFVICDSLTLSNGSILGPTRFEYCGLELRLHAVAPDGVLLNPFELLLEIGNYIATGAALVRRDAVLQIGLFDEGIKCGEDLDLWLRLSLRYRFAVVDDALVLRRIHTTNTSHIPWAMVTGSMKVYEKLERHAPAMAPGTRWRGLLRKKKAALLREEGALYLSRGELHSARKSWARSLRSSFTPRVAAYWLASFLPQPLAEALRNWKKQTLLALGYKY
jgi:glycosyltransferase involved in cell wall biosynthesis